MPEKYDIGSMTMTVALDMKQAEKGLNEFKTLSGVSLGITTGLVNSLTTKFLDMGSKILSVSPSISMLQGAISGSLGIIGKDFDEAFGTDIGNWAEDIIKWAMKIDEQDWFTGMKKDLDPVLTSLGEMVTDLGKIAGSIASATIELLLDKDVVEDLADIVNNLNTLGGMVKTATLIVDAKLGGVLGKIWDEFGATGIMGLLGYVIGKRIPKIGGKKGTTAGVVTSLVSKEISQDEPSLMGSAINVAATALMTPGGPYIKTLAGAGVAGYELTKHMQYNVGQHPLTPDTTQQTPGGGSFQDFQRQQEVKIIIENPTDFNVSVSQNP